MLAMTIEFFHDVLSCWCFNASERVRALVAAHPQVTVLHRAWPLGTDRTLFARLFPDPVAAKQEIVLQHWADAVRVEHEHRIRPELMMSRDFEYPYSMPAQRGCKAAEKQAGQQGHWDFFDRAQQAHLSDCENVADPDVLTRCARDVGLEVNDWLRDFRGPATRRRDRYGLGPCQGLRGGAGAHPDCRRARPAARRAVVDVRLPHHGGAIGCLVCRSRPRAPDRSILKRCPWWLRLRQLPRCRKLAVPEPNRIPRFHSSPDRPATRGAGGC